MAITVWQNHYTRLWRIIDEPEYCESAFVETIERDYSLDLDRQFVFIIGGYLPGSDWIMRLGEQERFEILSGCGDPTNYYADNVIIRVSNCQPIRSWIEKPIAQYSTETDAIIAYAELQCAVDILVEKDGTT